MNTQFAEFDSRTGYVTVIGRPLNPGDFVGAAAIQPAPVALVFKPTPGPVTLADWRQGGSGSPAPVGGSAMTHIDLRCVA